MTGSTSRTTLLAARDTEVAKIPRGLIQSFRLKFPNLFFDLLQKKVLGGQDIIGTRRRKYKKVEEKDAVATSIQGYCTVAVIPVTSGVPLQNITAELEYCLSELGLVTCVTAEVIKKALGSNALDPGNDFKVTAWLGAQEDQYDTIIFKVTQVYLKLCRKIIFLHLV